MHSARGFSLIETLVATSVLAAGLLGLAHVVTMAVAANVSARHTTSAAVLAAQKMEDLRSTPLAGATASVDYADAWGVVLPSGGEVPAGATYARRWRVVPLAGSAAAFIIHVRVEPATMPSDSAEPRAGSARLVAAVKNVP